MARCKRCNSFMIVASDTGYCKKCNAEVLRGIMDKEAKAKAEEQRRIAQQRKEADAEEQRKRAAKQREIDDMKRVGADSMFAMVDLIPDPISTFAAASGKTDNVLSDTEIAYLGMPAGIVELQAMNGATVLLHNNPDHAEKSAYVSVADGAYVRGKVIKSLGIEPGDKVMLLMQQLDSQPPQKSPNSNMYPHVIELKKMFASYLPVFKSSVIRDDDAWQKIDQSNVFWANQALESKRSGDYVEACRLYFKGTSTLNAITAGWASGIFKTLASAGDFADALAFGNEWRHYVDPAVGVQNDQIIIHYANLVVFLKNPEKQQTFQKYLQSISGNPNYSIDLARTDRDSAEVKEQLKMFG